MTVKRDEIDAMLDGLDEALASSPEGGLRSTYALESQWFFDIAMSLQDAEHAAIGLSRIRGKYQIA